MSVARSSATRWNGAARATSRTWRAAPATRSNWRPAPTWCRSAVPRRRKHRRLRPRNPRSSSSRASSRAPRPRVAPARAWRLNRVAVSTLQGASGSPANTTPSWFSPQQDQIAPSTRRRTPTSTACPRVTTIRAHRATSPIRSASRPSHYGECAQGHQGGAHRDDREASRRASGPRRGSEERALQRQEGRMHQGRDAPVAGSCLSVVEAPPMLRHERPRRPSAGDVVRCRRRRAQSRAAR